MKSLCVTRKGINCSDCTVTDNLQWLYCDWQPAATVLWLTTCSDCTVTDNLQRLYCDWQPAATVLWLTTCSDCTVTDNLQRLYCDWQPAATVLWLTTCSDCTVSRMTESHRTSSSEIRFTGFSYARVSVFRNAQPSDSSSALGYNLCRDERWSVLQAASCYLYGTVRT